MNPVFALVQRLREWLFGRVPPHGGAARTIATRLIEQLAHGGLDTLDDAQLMELVDFLLTVGQLRRPLRGNVRFLEDVAARYHRSRSISVRQRQAIHNILERAYPHNLAVEVRRFS